MGAVYIGVRHDDDLVIAQVIDLEPWMPIPHAQGLGKDVAYFG